MFAVISVLVFREDGGFNDYVKREVEINQVPKCGETLNFEGMRLEAWAVYEAWDGVMPIVICRVDPKEIDRLTAQKKLLSCGLRCESRVRRPKR